MKISTRFRELNSAISKQLKRTLIVDASPVALGAVRLQFEKDTPQLILIAVITVTVIQTPSVDSSRLNRRA